MIVTIDGPAGAGKSTVAKLLAQRLGFSHLDTGAMYRAVTLAALRQGIAWDDQPALEALAASLDLRLAGERVLLADEDITAAIRTPEITSLVRNAANSSGVRRRLIELQRRAAHGADIVTEGRDQGTLAFPQAECKFYLTASPEERARRRHAELTERGAAASLAEVLADQLRRDLEDQGREFGRLAPAPDAVQVTTDGLTPHQVAELLEQAVRARRAP